jgi:hypothetical protein
VADRNPGGEHGREDRLTDRIGLGVLTRLVHRDLVDEVLAETATTERRRRLLPARVVVYFVLAMTLFFDDAYEEGDAQTRAGPAVSAFLGPGLAGGDLLGAVPGTRPPGRRAGARALRAGGPAAGRPGTPGAWLADLRLMAIDGVQLDVPDTAENETAFGRGVSLGLDAPYPKVKVLGLGECGTHAVIDAHLGGVRVDERELARPLPASVEPGMLLLADRRFYSREFWDEAAETGAELLWRVQSSLTLHVVTELADGSYLSMLLTDIERQRIRRHRACGLDTVPEGTPVRVVEYDITNRDNNGGSPIGVDHHHPRSGSGLGRRARRGLSPTVGIRIEPRRDRNPPARQLPSPPLTQPRDGAPRDLGAAVDPLRDPHTDVRGRRPRTARPAPPVVHQDTADRPPPPHRAGGFSP